jgi:hypothetical protein
MAMVEDAPVSASKFDDRIKRWQAGLDFTKSMLLVLLVLAFLVYPSALWFVLERAGLRVTEFEIFGAKLTRTQEAAVDLDAALKQAVFDNQSLQEKLASTQTSLAEASKCLSDVDSLRNCSRNPELVKQLKLDEATVTQTRQLATNSAAAANLTLRNNESVLQESLAKVATRRSSWGIVFGGDVSQREAEAEIAKAKDAPNLAIYRKQRSFRSVAVFDNRNDAEDWLPRLKRINAGAYIVVLDRWCPNPTRQRADRYTLVECQG